VQNLLLSSLLSKDIKHKIYGIVILLCGCEASSEGSLRVIENRVLRRICKPKREDVRGEWRRWHRK
jgi:hypothetical protein